LKKILITGCNGLLGQKLAETAPPDTWLAGVDLQPEPYGPLSAYKVLDLTEGTAVAAALQEMRPDWILNTAAFTDVDEAEKKREPCRRINVSAVEHLISAAQTIGARLLHLSTDYVFDGNHGPYREEDTPNPIGYYGATKLAGEQALQRSSLKHVIVRTMVLYGRGIELRPNFVTWLIEKLRRQETVRIVTDQYGNTTLADELAEAIWQMTLAAPQGVYHLAGSEIIDRYHFAIKIAHIFDLDVKLIQPITTAELHQSAPRPLRSGLVVDKAYRELGLRLSDTETGLRRLRAQWSAASQVQ